MQGLIRTLLDGNKHAAINEARNLLVSGVSKEAIVTEGIQRAMSLLDAKCTAEQFNLLELMLVGRALTAVVAELYPEGTTPIATKGTVVTATLEGDIHDIGKNILKMILTAQGYRVVDCGKDCPVSQLIETADKEQAMAICVSGLITTVIPQVRQIKEILSMKGLQHIKVLAGGAALKQSTKEVLNVDFVAETAFEGARYLMGCNK